MVQATRLCNLICRGLESIGHAHRAHHPLSLRRRFGFVPRGTAWDPNTAAPNADAPAGDSWCHVNITEYCVLWNRCHTGMTHKYDIFIQAITSIATYAAMTLLRFDPLLIATSGYTALFPGQFLPHIVPIGEEPTCSSADSRVLYGWLVDGPNGPEIHLRDGVSMTLVDYDAAAAYAPNGLSANLWPLPSVIHVPQIFASSRAWLANVHGPPVLPLGGNGGMAFDFNGTAGWPVGLPPNLINFYQRTNAIVNLFENNEVRHHLANVRR
jgi:hypothetical protein